ncbi:hypothetical protein [Spiroplasma poulsonii]|uniref:hypothetical protein n=1 Tax=Spiroplasma poulsonii TaxID=2138 RepID=UPI001F4D1348|nr:hypothetical protein [Spiroplasma poulsonii]UNF62312.1 hypothetical protein MNU24_02290 [Spiroplasma poulsonii]
MVKVLVISEANCYRNIKWIEDILIKKLWFSTTCLVKSTNKHYFNDKTIIIDATETPTNAQKTKQSYSW